jgi:hypothetical protein
MPTEKRRRRPWIPPEEKTAILAILATLGLIIIFLGQSAARATDETAAKDLFVVCDTLDHRARAPHGASHRRGVCSPGVVRAVSRSRPRRPVAGK